MSECKIMVRTSSGWRELDTGKRYTMDEALAELTGNWLNRLSGMERGVAKELLRQGLEVSDNDTANVWTFKIEEATPRFNLA